MSWVPQMLEGIKAGKTRMEIAAEIGIDVGAISREAIFLARGNAYREAGITDEQYAEWQETSLIGLRTADGELVIERTKPKPEHIARNLKFLRTAHPPEYDLKALKGKRDYSGTFIADCTKCKFYCYDSRCPRKACEWNETTAINCRAYREREYIPREWWKK